MSEQANQANNCRIEESTNSDSLLIRAAKLGIRIVIEPENTEGTMNARKPITKVRVKTECETYGTGLIRLIAIEEFDSTVANMVIMETVEQTEKLKRFRP